MSSISDFPVNIQTSSESVPSPCWFGEVTLLSQCFETPTCPFRPIEEHSTLCSSPLRTL